MARILITHPIYEGTIVKLSLKKIHPSLQARADLSPIPEEVFYARNKSEEIFYIPGIAIKQQPNEKHDPSLEILRLALETIKPDVLIAGNNAVPGKAIAAWRAAVESDKRLLAIRRGVDTRAIDKLAASEYSVAVGNLPGINSPFVAKHMIKHLKLEDAKPGSKIAVVGVGNIGKNVAIEAIKLDLSVHLLSPSLQEFSSKRSEILARKGIPSEKVICAQSLEQALEGANYLSIAVPWEKRSGGTHVDTIGVNHIESLAANAKIASASVPRIFTEQALTLMNDRIKQGKIYVRIDSSKRRAVEAKQNYPYLDACHDQAFACAECQEELDNAMLEKARAFVSNSVLELVK